MPRSARRSMVAGASGSRLPGRTSTAVRYVPGGGRPATGQTSPQRPRPSEATPAPARAATPSLGSQNRCVKFELTVDLDRLTDDAAAELGRILRYWAGATKNLDLTRPQDRSRQSTTAPT